MAEVAELDHKLIEGPLVLDPFLKLIDLMKKMFTPKTTGTCPLNKPNPFDKYYFGM